MLKLLNKYVLYLLVLVFLIAFTSISAQSIKVEKLVYNGEPLREIAEKYFGNPDYWETILKYNNISSVSKIKKGMTIKIPSGLVAETLKKLDEAKSVIAEANSNGAKILTPGLISEAENEFEEVNKFKRESKWQQAFDSVQNVIAVASRSLEQVSLLRKTSADATISFVKGDVQKRKPKERLWSEADLFAKLYEADRARTLDDSFAEITFIDLSRIRLNDNSQALIQHSRVDVLKNKTETKVKLIKGDAFAFLLNSPKKKFDIDVPGLNAKIKSKSFWIEKKPKNTKIANFQGEIELSAKDSVVVVKENQGSTIPDGGVPTKPKDLLPPPTIISPVNLAKLTTTEVMFKWKEDKEASKYWIEVARDNDFKELFYSNKNIFKPEEKIKNIPAGSYFWHVCSIDETGFPGEFSTPAYFLIAIDKYQPYLIVTKPIQNKFTKESSISVVGETEKNVSLYVNGEKIEVSEDGSFNSTVTLHNFKNSISIKALDQSGNETLVKRNVFFESSDKLLNVINSSNFNKEKNKFLVNSKYLNIKGNTLPYSRIEFTLNNKNSNAVSDSLGNYSSSFILENDTKMLGVKIISQTGQVISNQYKIEIDNVAPTIKFDSSLPKHLRENKISISGELKDGYGLRINSKEILLKDSRFKHIVNLAKGQNNIFMEGYDLAGNIVEKTYTIFVDNDAPRFQFSKISQVSKKQKSFKVEIKAEDSTLLKKYCIAIILVDGNEQKIALKLNSATNIYTDILYNANDKPNILGVTLEDYLGNSKYYKIEK